MELYANLNYTRAATVMDTLLIPIRRKSWSPGVFARRVSDLGHVHSHRTELVTPAGTIDDWAPSIRDRDADDWGHVLTHHTRDELAEIYRVPV